MTLDADFDRTSLSRMAGEKRLAGARAEAEKKIEDAKAELEKAKADIDSARAMRRASE